MYLALLTLFTFATLIVHLTIPSPFRDLHNQFYSMNEPFIADITHQPFSIHSSHTNDQKDARRLAEAEP